MSSRHLVDPELAAMLEAPALDLVGVPLTQSRAAMAQLFAALSPPMPEGMAPREVRLDGASALVFAPPAAPSGLRGAILHIHGGGFVLGSAAMGASVAALRALEHDAIVVSVDYRLAPETPFPGPLEDCYAGLQWLFANASELGVDPARVVLMGESAGGGLAAALALMTRDRGGPQPAGQVLTYPMLDHRTASEDDASPHPLAGEFGWTPAFNRVGWSAMRGDYAMDDARIGWFSPAHAVDLAGLPPAFIATGTLDLFVEEDIEYARRLTRAGVPTELHVYPGAPHGFDMLAGAAVAQQFMADRKRALTRFLRGA